MTPKAALEFVAGIVLIILGILFFLFLGLDASSVVTDVIFIGAGVILIRRAIRSSRESGVEIPKGKKKSNRA